MQAVYCDGEALEAYCTHRSCTSGVGVRHGAPVAGEADLKGRHAVQMSMHDCVFYYWSDEQWDSCDKFREAATPILNPNGVPGLLDWRASGTQVWCLATCCAFSFCLAPA